MGQTKSWTSQQARGTAKSTPSRVQRVFRYLESLCRQRKRSFPDPAPGSHFRAYRQRQGLPRSLSYHNDPEKRRPVSPECSPPDSPPFPVELRSLTALEEFKDHSNLDGDNVPAAGYAEAEAQGISDLQSYRFGQINENVTEKDDEAVSPTTPATAETKDELEVHDSKPAEQSRKDSLVANLRSLHSRMSALGEKISLSASELTGNIALENQPQMLKETSNTIRTENDELGKKADNPSVLANFDSLLDKIKFLEISLQDPITEPQLAFYANAWLAVHQMNDLESTAMELLSDMENNGLWAGKTNSSVQASAAFSYRVSVSLPNMAKEVNPRCERLVTVLEKLALQAPMPRPLSTEAIVCPSCGKEKD